MHACMHARGVWKQDVKVIQTRSSEDSKTYLMLQRREVSLRIRRTSVVRQCHDNQRMIALQKGFSAESQERDTKES